MKQSTEHNTHFLHNTTVAASCPSPPLSYNCHCSGRAAMWCIFFYNTKHVYCRVNSDGQELQLRKEDKKNEWQWACTNIISLNNRRWDNMPIIPRKTQQTDLMTSWIMAKHEVHLLRLPWDNKFLQKKIEKTHWGKCAPITTFFWFALFYDNSTLVRCFFLGSVLSLFFEMVREW